MIRILHVVNDMHRAGLETMLMNYYRNIDRTKIQFDFLTHRPNKSDYDDEIISMGGKVYYAPRLYPQNYVAYFKWMKQFFKDHPEYKIMHSHIDSMSYLPLLAAKKAGIPVRIAHSHNTSIDRDFKYPLKQYFRFKIKSVANTYFACGKEAGEFLFGNDEFTVIPNAVEAEKFYYDENIRVRKRNELGLINEFVIGHVGRMSYQKNHKFLIEIFNDVIKLNSNSVLLLIGVGEKEDEIKKQVRYLGIQEKVLFLGSRNDVSELYQAMDVFVLPSFFEGIPVVGVEAQFANLPCFFSNKTPSEVKFNNKSQFLDLDISSQEWAKQIIQTKGDVRERMRTSIVKSSYDIRKAHFILESYYIDFMKNLEICNEKLI